MCVQVVTGRPPIHQREKKEIKWKQLKLVSVLYFSSLSLSLSAAKDWVGGDICLCAASTEYTSSRRGQWIRKNSGRHRLWLRRRRRRRSRTNLCERTGDSIAHTTALSKMASKRWQDSERGSKTKQQQQQHWSETLFQQLTGKALRADWRAESGSSTARQRRRTTKSILTWPFFSSSSSFFHSSSLSSVTTPPPPSLMSATEDVVYESWPSV